MLLSQNGLTIEAISWYFVACFSEESRATFNIYLSSSRDRANKQLHAAIEVAKHEAEADISIEEQPRREVSQGLEVKQGAANYF
jgi:hypothetical protein